MRINLALGIGLPLEYEGQLFWLRPCTWRMLGQVEGLLAAEALARVERTRASAGPDAYQVRLDTVAEMITRGEYDQGGKAYAAALRTRKGFAKLVWAMMQESGGRACSPSLEQAEQLSRTHNVELATRIKILSRAGRKKDGDGKKAPPFETLVAVLASEPLLLSVEQVGDLTPYQTSEIYFHARDSKGALVIPGQGDELQGGTDTRVLMAVFLKSWQEMGLTPEQIDARWEAMFDRMAGIK